MFGAMHPEFPHALEGSGGGEVLAPPVRVPVLADLGAEVRAVEEDAVRGHPPGVMTGHPGEVEVQSEVVPAVVIPHPVHDPEHLGAKGGRLRRAVESGDQADRQQARDQHKRNKTPAWDGPPYPILGRRQTPFSGARRRSHRGRYITAKVS